jgi:DNA-binding IclR family transcriptional regulator
LSYLARQRASVPAATIASALELPRSTVYHLLAALLQHGFVVNGDRRWALGLAAHDLGSGYLRQQPLALVGRAVIARLVDTLGENAHLAVLNDRDVVYVVEERAPGRPSLVTDVGVRLPAHLTASGRAMLAALPPEQIRALYPDDSMLAARGGAITTRRALRDTLRVSRQRTFAIERGDVTEGLSSIAVPILDRVGWPLAALAVTFPDHPGDGESLVPAVRDAAAEIARRLRI